MDTELSNIAHIRQDYLLAELNEEITGNDPISFFGRWFNEAMNANISEVNAMTLATVSTDEKPHARIVLLKGVYEGKFVFYTNYTSAKGNQMADNQSVALLFFWKELERQVRIEGTITQVPAADSDAYFQSRPVGSQVGAWASPQSSIIEGREVLENLYQHYEQEYAGKTIPRPSHWGGYQVTPHFVEFWQGRSSRLHDRIAFKLSEGGAWHKVRLAP